MILMLLFRCLAVAWLLLSVFDGVVSTGDGSDVQEQESKLWETYEIRLPSVERYLKKVANAMFDDYWESSMRMEPEWATTLGDHRFDDRLDKYGLLTIEQRKLLLQGFLNTAEELKRWLPEDSVDLRSDLVLFSTNLRYKLEQLNSPSIYFPLSKLHTPKMSFFHLLKYLKLDGPEDYWNLLARYRAIPSQIDGLIEIMRRAIELNYTLSDRSMFTGREEANETVEDTQFFEPFLNISFNEMEMIQKNASAVIEEDVLPALARLADFLENEYNPKARPGIGVGSLPKGQEFYQERLSHHLSVRDATPEDIHNLGLQEVDRIAAEMDEVIRTLGFNLTREEFSEQLRNDESQYFSSSEEALETYRQAVEKDIIPKLTKIFTKVPKYKFEVQKVPDEFAGGVGAYYTRPSTDGTTPGTFFLDTSDLKNVLKYDVTTLALHEGLPGHHFQHAYLYGQDELHNFKKYDSTSSAFTEGWGLYSEYLGYELGLFEDPYQRYGHLSYEIFRAGRMVVDTGIHVMGWSRQQAIDYMLNNSAMARGSIENEVDRYITWPGQACSYKFGELKIKQLRERAERELGEKFNIKDFHDVILLNPGPIELLESHVLRYIQKNLPTDS